MSLLRWIQGSAHHLPMLADESVQMIATSPPFWNLRKYSGKQSVDWPEVSFSPMAGLPEITIPAQTCDLGLEERIEDYIGHLILCLREWRRILRSDGTAWINLSDSYANTGNPGQDFSASQVGYGGKGRGHLGGQPQKSMPRGLKPKDLCLIPSRFALAAQADGWWVRSDIIWHKPNPMPESVTDRPTKSHEYIFLLAKSQDYFYDADAVREKNAPAYQEMPANGAGIIKMRKRPPEQNNNHISMAAAREYNGAGRNLRSVWTVATQPTGIQHFATWPERLVETMIRAGSSAHGCCSACGKPYVRIVERTPMEIARSSRREAMGEWGRTQSSGTMTKAPTSITTGWQPACECGAGDAVPCVVMDPFSGSSTTGKVAIRLGRSYIGVDISDVYLNEITLQRLGNGTQMEIPF